MHKAAFFLPSSRFSSANPPVKQRRRRRENPRLSPPAFTTLNHIHHRAQRDISSLFVPSFAPTIFSQQKVSLGSLPLSLSLSSFSKGGGGAQIGSGSKLTLSSFSSPPSVPLQLWCTRKNLPHSLGSPSFEETVVRSSSFFPDRRMDRPSLSPMGK